MERTGLRRAQEAVLPLWERTRLFRTYSSWLIPGAVQTRAYTTAVLRAIAARRDLPDDVDDAVAVRADRLRLLREGDHRFLVLIEEAVLRNVIGGAEVMAGQLGHLITVGSLPSVSVGIIPMNLDRDAAWPVEDFCTFVPVLGNHAVAGDDQPAPSGYLRYLLGIEYVRTCNRARCPLALMNDGSQIARIRHVVA
jgi:hypothetical protein